MTVDAVVVQALNGLAAASGLFLVAAGLSLIFGVSRIINMAHGSLYMVGIYLAYTLATTVGLGFWAAVVAAALAVAALGALIEIVLLRRIYGLPELFQLLATFALVLIVNDATLFLWGPEDLLGPRAPGLRGAVEILGRRFPRYDLFLIAIGPAILIVLHFVLARTRFGRLVRAATQDREMVGALGVNQALLFTAVFTAGSFLSGLGGALQLAREPASLAMDLNVIGDAFVVVVGGGMGSIPGAYLAAVLIAEIKALCIAAGVVHIAGVAINFSKLTLVAEFIVMAAVLIVRPHGLLGGIPVAPRPPARGEEPLRPGSATAKAGAALLLIALVALAGAQKLSPYTLVLGTDVVIAVIFAVSLQFIMGPGGMHSFGHAAYFGLGTYATALLVKLLKLPMALALGAAPVLAGIGALLFGWFAVRLSGIYLAMLTLAFAQIVWSIVFQWQDITGGSNGVLGVWPPPPFDAAWVYYLLCLAFAVLVVVALRTILFAPFGYAMRAGRDSPLRAEAIGINVKAVHWLAFAIAGVACGIAGGLYAFAKGSISPETIDVGRSIDGIVMVLLGGLEQLGGAIVGAGIYAILQDTVMRQTQYWHALLGVLILTLVLAFPGGIAGFASRRIAAWRTAAGGRSS